MASGMKDLLNFCYSFLIFYLSVDFINCKSEYLVAFCPYSPSETVFYRRSVKDLVKFSPISRGVSDRLYVVLEVREVK